MFNHVLGLFRIAATSLSKTAKAVLVNLDGGGSSQDPDQWPEFAIGQALFGTIGLIVRPRAPTRDANGQNAQATALAAKTGDGLMPFAGRDTRLNAFYPNPKEGDVALVGYGGAFISNSPKLDAAGNVIGNELVIYVPYEFDGNGVPTKAHTIEVLGTPAEKSLSVIHAEGMAITMKAGGKNSVVIKNKAGNAYVEVNDDGNVLNGNTVINGGATIGSPVGALPLALATKLALYFTQLETDIATAVGAAGPGGPAAATAFTAAAAARSPMIAAAAATKASAL